ncbi:endogenous retrovirus group K member 5 Gag polyprotein-like [Phasianus colchicus]|uniref:endogenous retrovirus group K member 5 Gag polyprotein-like n=1 Tax=Phasianus colchicus TaxID=9054 RepID=UPI00129D6C05|nr:endogenous retrovirus group K member 5 Gag polyprotein-like [Phasianus colchicus]
MRGGGSALRLGEESRWGDTPDGAGNTCVSNWQKVREPLQERGLVTIFPVVVGEEGPEWVPLDPKGIALLIEEIEKKGLKSPLTLNALEALTEPGHTLLYDIENLICMALKPVQYTLSKEEWLIELRWVIAAAQNNPGHPVHGTNMLRLTGSATGMVTPRGQLAQLCPGELIATTDAALGAFRRFACHAEPSTPWTEIIQGPTESFQDFANRLIKAVEGSDLPRAVHGPVIVDCLKQKSLEDIKNLFHVAPGEITTQGEIIKYVLDKQKSTPLTNEGLAAALADAMAVASMSPKGPCFQCGQYGHIKTQCNAIKDGERDSVSCQLCGRGGHNDSVGSLKCSCRETTGGGCLRPRAPPTTIRMSQYSRRPCPTHQFCQPRC